MIFARYCKTLLSLGQASCLIGNRSLIGAGGLLVFVGFPLAFFIPARANPGLVGTIFLAGVLVMVAAITSASLFVQDTNNRQASYLASRGFRRRDFACYGALIGLPINLVFSLLFTFYISLLPGEAVILFVLSLALSEVLCALLGAWAVSWRASAAYNSGLRHARRSLGCPRTRMGALIFKSFKIVSAPSLVLSFLMLAFLAFFLAFFLVPFPVYAYLLYALITLLLNVFLDAEYANGKTRFNRYYGMRLSESAWSKSALTSLVYVVMVLLGWAWYLAPPSPVDIALAVPVVVYGVIAQFGIAALLSCLRWSKEVNLVLELLILIFSFVPLLPLVGIVLASSRKRMAT